MSSQSTTSSSIAPSPTLSILGKKIAFSAFIQYIGKGIQLLLAAISLKLISSFLSADGNFGIYASISEYALFFSVIANLGIFANVVRKMADDPLNGEIFFNSLVLRAVTAGSLFLIGIVISIVQAEKETTLFILGSVFFLTALFFDLITSVCNGMLQANYLMGKATFALVTGRLLSFAGVVMVIINFVGISGFTLLLRGKVPPSSPDAIVLFFVATLMGSFLTAVLSFYFVRQKVQLHWNIDTKFMLNILKASLPFGIISLINSLYFRFLPDYFSHGILNNSQFGAFNISMRIADVASLFSTFLVFSALPAFKQCIDQKQWQKTIILYRKLWWILAGSGVALVVFGTLLAPTLIGFLSHKNYFLPEFWFILPMMLLLAAISYAYDLVLITLFAMEKDLWFLKREIVALCIAGLVFGLSFGFPDIHTRLIFIILGAIVGEGTMVLAGSLKVRKIFASATGD